MTARYLSGMRILIAEDETTLARQVQAALAAEGHVVDHADNGEDAHFLGDTEPYDLIILDLGLPMRDGISVLKRWRADGRSMPVLILTARDAWTDRVDGLDAGADDYLAKPFHMPELLARARALLRRNAASKSAVFERSGISYDSRNGRVTKDHIPVNLTAQEVAVLSYLFHHANRHVTQTELSEHIYQYDDDKDSNTIAVFITRLRKKLGADLIETERGRGYMIKLAS